MRTFQFVSLILLIFSLHVFAGVIKSKGELALEGRVFSDDNNPNTNDGNLNLFARYENRYKRGLFQVRLRGFGRLDKEDKNRNVFAIEEAWVGFQQSGWSIKLGAQMLNWSATEAFHPADMMNSRLLDSDIENQEKFGEFMLRIRKKLGRGSVSLFIIPKFQSPKFPSAKSRLNFLPGGFEVGKALWLKSNGQIASHSYGFQWGIRVSQTIGSADFSAHYIRHQDRHQPLILLDSTIGKFRPLYLPVRDIGGTFLQVMGSWIFKVEYNYRNFVNPKAPVYLDFTGWIPLHQPDHHQLALGLEYGWSYSSGSEGTIIGEGQGIFGVSREQRSQLHPFQRDLLVGYRHAFNDVLSREILVTMIFDIERKREYLLNVSYRQRISDTWTMRLGLRLVEAPLKGASPKGLEALHKSNQVFMKITKHF